jgi:hypothetical protein
MYHAGSRHGQEFPPPHFWIHVHRLSPENKFSHDQPPY